MIISTLAWPFEKNKGPLFSSTSDLGIQSSLSLLNSGAEAVAKIAKTKGTLFSQTKVEVDKVPLLFKFCSGTEI